MPVVTENINASEGETFTEPPDIQSLPAHQPQLSQGKGQIDGSERRSFALNGFPLECKLQEPKWELASASTEVSQQPLDNFTARA